MKIQRKLFCSISLGAKFNMLVDLSHWCLRNFKGGLKANLMFPQKQKCSCFRLINIWFSFFFVPYHFPSTFPRFCSMNLKILLHMVLLHFTHLIPLLIVVSSSGFIFSTAISSLSWKCGDAPVALICNPFAGVGQFMLWWVRHFRVGGDFVFSARNYWTVWQRTRQIHTRRVP